MIKKYLSLILLAFFISAKKLVPDFQTICSPLSNKMTTLTNIKEEVEFSIQQSFESAKKSKDSFLGEGAKGLVLLVDTPLEKYPKVAIKYMTFSENTSLEIFLALEMGKRFNSPRLIACQFGDLENWPIPIYLVFEKLDGDLEDQQTRNCIKKINKNDRLFIYKKMLLEIYDLYQFGYLHNDIKPANFVYSKDMNIPYLTDFGLASDISEELPIAGSPYFVSPGRFLHEGVSQKHDLYSWAMTVVFIESNAANLNDCTLFYKTKWSINNPFSLSRRLDPEGFLGTRTPEFKVSLVNNVIDILQPVYGNYVDSDHSSVDVYINFTSLIAAIISYDEFKGGYFDVIIAIIRFIADFYNLENENFIKEKLITI